jgi:hypothetical protein
MKHLCLQVALLGGLFMGCSEESNPTETPEPRLIVRFEFDPNQQRLDNLGRPAEVALGNAAQSPVVQKMSAHYLEFTPNTLTPLGNGSIAYQGDETAEGGALAIDFQDSFFAEDGQVWLNVPLSRLSPGSYEWVRVSLSYQEGDIQLVVNGSEITGRLASFVGYNSYITSFDLNEQKIAVNGNRLQGFWAFEALGFTEQGQAPAGATTVPNPLFETSPIPQGSCVVTGAFEEPLRITGEETEDLEITLSFSVNNSFEWQEVVQDGKFEPSAGEEVVDMGLRGLIPRRSN